MTRQEVQIPADGGQIAAYVYRPQVTGGGTACIVMAHGFTGTRDDGLPDYAEAFCAAGHTVVLFDYRHFGASTGEPRQLLDIAEQRRDYHTVIAWARHLDGVDPNRIVVWGSSFSGGHVLAVAAEDPRIAAVIAQAPFTDALATLREIPPRNIPLLLIAAVRDQVGAWRGRPPHTVAAVGSPGTVAALTSPDAKPGFEAILGPPHVHVRVQPARPQGRETADAGAAVCLRRRRRHPAGTVGRGGAPRPPWRTAPLPVRPFRHLSRPEGQGRPAGVPGARRR
ncbi:alpha/beta fold hydrolase [Mycolicibacterium vanbaalenii]|uniref:alpha/beta hydrolase n=1 Tax=Mycolicibacterium austroafricanum TaxID=39687 RepID=UPI001F2B8E28|nr:MULTISPECIES: alpha/beta fold hydrolase [Mycolicibacterium]WND59090.1 alpha/beta fold hydrolase [Mycolicibacterium vanbaalenii]